MTFTTAAGGVILALGLASLVLGQLPAEDPDAATTAAFAKAGCAGCHTIPGIPNAVGLVGPELSSIGTEAASRRPGVEAAAYIQEAIVDPSAFIAPQCPGGPCPENVMPPNFAERLSAEEITLRDQCSAL